MSYGGISLESAPAGFNAALLSPPHEAREFLPHNHAFGGDPPSGLRGFWPKPVPGRLWWPRGASRWAVAYVLADDARLEAIRDLAYAAGTIEPLDLVIYDDTNTLTTSLWMLSARPLHQFYRGDGKKRLYLLTLVDDRYLWWMTDNDVSITDGTTTWAQFFSSCGTALGATLTLDTAVHAEYLKPSSLLPSSYPALVRMLDAGCACVGRRLVRKVDGTVLIQTAAEAKISQDDQIDLTTGFGKRFMAGGTFDYDPDTDEDENDLIPAAPASVIYYFPAAGDGAASNNRYARTVTLDSLNLEEYGDSLGMPGCSKFFYAGPLATHAGSGTPSNSTELNALADRHAADWYRWQLGRMDKTYPGCPDYTPHGMADEILWEHNAALIRCRVMAGGDDPFDVEFLPTYGSSGSSGVDVCCSTFTNPITLVPTHYSLTTSQNNYSVTTPTTYITPTAGTSITGFTVDGGTPTPGTQITLVNTSTTTTFTIPHESASSTAANRVETPTGTDLVVPVNSAVTLQYGLDSRWHPVDSGMTYTHQSPSQITSDQNNYAITGEDARLTSDADWDLTGITAVWPGRKITLTNVGSFDIGLKHQSASSTAANRIITPTGLDYAIAPSTSVELTYDGTTERWRVTGGSAGSSTSGTWSLAATITHADLTDADGEQDITIYTLPAKGRLEGIVIKHSASFTGGGAAVVSATTRLAGVSGITLDVFQAAGATVFGIGGETQYGDQLDFGSTQALVIRFSADVNVADLTAGSLDVWIKAAVLP